MKSMKSTALILLLFFSFTIFPGMAQSAWAPRAGWMNLNLTDEQLDKILDLRLTFQKDMLALSNKLRVMYLELDTMELKGEDQAKVDVRLKDLDQMEQDLEQKFAEHRTQIRNLLTDEQKTLFDAAGGLGLGPEMGMMPGMMGMGRGGFAPGYGRMMGAGRGFFRGQRMGFRNSTRGRAFWGPGAGWAGQAARFGQNGAGYGRFGTGFFVPGSRNQQLGNRWIAAGAPGRFCPRFYYNPRYLNRYRR